MRPRLPVLSGRSRLQLPVIEGDASSDTESEGGSSAGTFRIRHPPGYRPIITRRASASPISTKADVTSGPPTRMRVGVFILFHS